MSKIEAGVGVQIFVVGFFEHLLPCSPKTSEMIEMHFFQATSPIYGLRHRAHPTG